MIGVEMPSAISKSRLQKAFNEGRRSAQNESTVNPYENPKLRELWEQGRAKQRAGEIATPIPLLEHGETRARPHVQNPRGNAAGRFAPGRRGSSRR
jgi:hypothetical protein